MSLTITPVSVSSNDTFGILVTRVNTAIDFISSQAVSANNLANGAVTTGNAIVNGIFGSTTLFAGSFRGGNVQASAALPITSNVTFTGNTFNLAATSNIVMGNTSANTTQVTTDKISVGANLIVNASTITFNGINYTGLLQTILVQNSGANIANTAKLNFIAGTNATINATANASTNTVDIVFNVTANGILVSAGGSNTQVQFADGTQSNGAAAFTYNKTTNTVTMQGNLNSNGILLGNTIYQIAKSVNVTAASTNTVLDFFALTDYRGIEYTLSVTDNAANNYAFSKLLLLQDGGNAYTTEYAQLVSNSAIGTFAGSTNATHAILAYTTVTSANVTIKLNKIMANP